MEFVYGSLIGSTHLASYLYCQYFVKQGITVATANRNILICIFIGILFGITAQSIHTHYITILLWKYNLKLLYYLYNGFVIATIFMFSCFEAFVLSMVFLKWIVQWLTRKEYEEERMQLLDKWKTCFIEFRYDIASPKLVLQMGISGMVMGVLFYLMHFL